MTTLQHFRPTEAKQKLFQNRVLKESKGHRLHHTLSTGWAKEKYLKNAELHRSRKLNSPVSCFKAPCHMDVILYFEHERLTAKEHSSLLTWECAYNAPTDQAEKGHLAHKVIEFHNTLKNKSMHRILVSSYSEVSKMEHNAHLWAGWICPPNTKSKLFFRNKNIWNIWMWSEIISEIKFWQGWGELLDFVLYLSSWSP